MFSSSSILSGLRSIWSVGLSIPLCRKCKPWQIPLIILKRVAQSSVDGATESRPELCQCYGIIASKLSIIDGSNGGSPLRP
jgi:hypothetical protein